MKRFPSLAAAAFAALLASPATAADMEVDVELVLAVDISRSMDVEELRIQRQGYVDAFRDPAVARAIEGGLLGRVAVTYVEWAGPGISDRIAGWTLLDDAESAAGFADLLAKGPIRAALGTSISGVLVSALHSFERNGYAGLRRVIDVSGDGPNNAGGGVEAARDRVLEAGVAINGLPLMMKARDGPFSLRDLDVYYEDCVIGGPLGFLLPVWSLETFAETIKRKLILEIAGRAPPPTPFRRAAAEGRAIPAQMGLGPPEREPRMDCFIGEKLRRAWVEDRGWDW